MRFEIKPISPAARDLIGAAFLAKWKRIRARLFEQPTDDCPDCGLPQHEPSE